MDQKPKLQASEDWPPAPRPVGRPATGRGFQVNLTLARPLTSRLDHWRARRPKPTSRQTAIRELVAKGLQ